MKQHGHLEIVRREHHGDVGEMLADLVAVLGVSHVIRFHWNDAAGVCQQEVVSGLFVGKAHRLIATGVDGCVVLVVLPQQGLCREQTCDSKRTSKSHAIFFSALMRVNRMAAITESADITKKVALQP